MTLREAIQALREYALTPQIGPDATGLAEAYREIVGDSVSHMLQEWKDDGELRREAQKLAAAMDDPQLGSRELDSVLREHVHRLVRGEAEPQTVKAAPEKVRMSPEHRDEPRTLGG